MSKNTVERFSNRVENYVKYRPGYPREMLDFFRDKLNLQRSYVIADIGSGTGISTRLFLENGNKVFGIEPNNLMREAAEEFLRDFPDFKSINGTAENTKLLDNSVDFITVAQAFHWFDKVKVPLEFRRILRDNGHIVLIWNERQLDSNEFLREYEKFLLEYGTDYEKVRHEQITKEVLEESFQTIFHQAIFQNSQILDFKGLKGRMLSSSYMPSAEHPRYKEMIKNLKSLFAKFEKNDKIQVLYDTNVFYTEV